MPKGGVKGPICDSKDIGPQKGERGVLAAKTGSFRGKARQMGLDTPVVYTLNEGVWGVRSKFS